MGAWLALFLLTASPSEEVKSEAKARIQDIEQDLEDWDIEGAHQELDALEKAISPALEPVRYLHGRVAFEEGRYDEAATSLKGAGVEDKPGSYLRLALDTQAIVKDYAHADSEHFIFFYPPGKDEILAPWALQTLEAQRAALEAALGFAPPGKVRVELVTNDRQLAKASTLTVDEINTTGTIAICKFNKLIVTSPKAVPHGYDWRDTLAHEFTHLVVSRKSRNSVPIWLHEGIAKYFETAWRGAPGLALTPSNLALLGQRVRANTLVPFEKMHPSMALLPTAEDAATAFAEVFFAIDYLYGKRGAPGVRDLVEQLEKGDDDKHAVEHALGVSFAAFERLWLAHIRAQPFPKELIPHDYHSPAALTERLKQGGKDAAAPKKKDREIAFGDFAEVAEPDARKAAHLGELFRERNHMGAAADEYARAHALVGDRYESVSNKYALALLELKRDEEAEKVLMGSLRVHPAVPATQVHLGRVYLRRKDFPKAREAFMGALAADPFDEEIHFSLAAIYGQLGDVDLKERTRHAAAVLTGLSPADVDRVAQRLIERTP